MYRSPNPQPAPLARVCAALLAAILALPTQASVMRIDFTTAVNISASGGASAVFGNEFGLASLSNAPVSGHFDIDLSVAPISAGPSFPNLYAIAGAAITLGNRTLTLRANPDPAVTGGALAAANATAGYDTLGPTGGPSSGWIIARPSNEIPAVPSAAYDFIFDWSAGDFYTTSDFALSGLNLYINEYAILDSKDLASDGVNPQTPGFFSLSTIALEIAVVNHGGTFAQAAKYSASNQGMNNGLASLTGTLVPDAPVPLPMPLVMIGLGLALLPVRRRRGGRTPGRGLTRPGPRSPGPAGSLGRTPAMAAGAVGAKMPRRAHR